MPHPQTKPNETPQLRLPQFQSMATILFSSSALLSTTATISSPSQPPPNTLTKSLLSLPKPLSSSLTAAATAFILLSSPPSLADQSSPTFNTYYGTAASAANYGGYGGNASKKDTAEYTYEVPDGWKERLVSKVEKGTNGTDSEFYNPKKRSEREYLTFLSGFRALAPMDAVLNNLALSDVDLQDLIASAEGAVKAEEERDGKGQVYYKYEIEGAGAHSLISVTCARNKLYAHFVNAPNPDWNKDKDTLLRLHDSFKTVDESSS